MATPTALQQGDVAIFQTNDEGDILVQGGVVEMTGGLEVAAYLALFGGNVEDDGSSGNALQYWGNIGETSPARKQVSRTQHIINGLPATTGNLKRVEDAAKLDLQFFITDKIASSVTVTVGMPAVKRIRITIAIDAFGFESVFEFTENWEASIT